MSGAAGLAGEAHWNWRGGRHRFTAGYIGVRAADHPKADRHGYVYEHVLVVEHALGKLLRPRAQVHHVNGDKSDNANGNLVACQDAAYHNLLHQRQRALAACGNANWRRCARCKGYSEPAQMVSHQGNAVCHLECRRAACRAAGRARRARRAA